MEPMLLGISIGLLLVVGGFLAYVSTRPSEFKVARSTVISAPPAVIFPLINDLHQWSKWSPWEHLDPEMNKVFSGAPEGVGAAYAWSGNNKVGEGNMKITGNVPLTSVALTIEFLKPWQAVNDTVFTLAQSAHGTAVTWEMTGNNKFFLKVMSVLINMDKLVGKDFERGLADLKRVSEVA